MGIQHVLVAGGGPAGFVTALGLAGRYGIKVTVIEAGDQIADSPRAMVYHWSVLQGLEDLGILDEAVNLGFAKQDYSFIVHRTGEKVAWSLEALNSETKHPYNLHLGQNLLAEIACRRLEANPLASIRFGTSLTDLEQDGEGVTATLSGPEGITEERFDWVIGADGGGSTVREKILGLNFFGITWPERFIATNVRLPFEKHGYARANMVMDDVYGAIIAKIDKDDLWRVTVMEDAALPVETIRDRIHHFYETYVPGITPEDYELVQFSPYRMHQRCADTMRVGRVILVGDAAHITNPTGGLGLTSGLFDSYFLGQVMNAIVNEGAPHDLLDRYSNERRRIFLEIASPQASRNKQRVFHSAAGTWFDKELEQVRRLATDRDAVLAQANFTKLLQSTL